MFTSPLFWLCIFSLFSAQLLKTIVNMLQAHTFDIRKSLSTGGMPSSHSSLVTTLITLMAFTQGGDSNEFAISLVFGGIVMYDAMGVRQAAGKHAEILNQLLENFHEVFHEKNFPVALKTMLGHTFNQVMAGMAYGFLVGYFGWRWFF